MKNVKIFTENIDSKSLEQVREVTKYFPDSKIRIMPDVHAGIGCVIGFTADLGERVIPNIVGLDIGCGIISTNLGKVEIDLEQLDKIIHKNIPSGFNVREVRLKAFNYSRLRCYSKLENRHRFDLAIGTLGGGNHFIELGRAENGNVYLTIHSGSRSLGNQVARYYQKLAVSDNKERQSKDIRRIIKKYRGIGQEHLISDKLKKIRRLHTIPKKLCYLEGKSRKDYLNDMRLCQEYASLNRECMIEIILRELKLQPKEIIETIHNYIDFEDNIVRKGAISARKDEVVIIPINMRDGCIIAKGKGNEDWNNSAPHGAGRLMSRTEAMRTISLEEFENTMKDIYSTTVSAGTLDEAPEAYKSMEEIIETTRDTIDVLDIIKPVYSFKGE